MYSDDGVLALYRVEEVHVSERKVWDGVNELKGWEWTYGQTPEFINLIEGELGLGKLVCLGPDTDTHRQTAQTTARKGILTSCSLNPTSTAAVDKLEALSADLIGDRYETLDASPTSGSNDRLRDEVIAWLRSSM